MFQVSNCHHFLESLGKGTSKSHHVDHHFTERIFLFLAEVLEDVTVFFLQQFKAHSQVVILQNRSIIVH